MLRSRVCFCWLCVTVGVAVAAALFLAAPPSANAQAPVSFINDIAPILKENCFGCHGAKNPKGKLDMTKYETPPQGRHQGRSHRARQAGRQLHHRRGQRRRTGRACRPRKRRAARPRTRSPCIERWIKEGAKLDAGIAKETGSAAGAAHSLEAAGAAGRLSLSRSPSPRWRSRRTTRNSSSAAITN